MHTTMLIIMIIVIAVVYYIIKGLNTVTISILMEVPRFNYKAHGYVCTVTSFNLTSISFNFENFEGR